MISSRADEVDKKRGFEAGVDDYITKPFAQDRLAACVGKYLR
jgi:two-component system phosphate regulon response regulator PhoB